MNCIPCSLRNFIYLGVINMKANETNFQVLIEGTKQYVVPLYQRSYSWEEKNWETLWNDLLEL